MTPSRTSSSSPSPTRTHLLSLPDEFLTVIVLNLDKPTALSIALVCQRLSPLADHIIWRDIKLLVRDVASDEELDVLVDEAARAAEAELGYRYKVLDLLALVTFRRASMVRSLTIVPLPEAVDPIVDLLRLVAPKLQSLTLEAHANQHHQAGDPKDTLDVKLLAADLIFPSLRFLSLRPGVTRYRAFGPYLASLAPKLDTLEYHAQVEVVTGADTDLETTSPPYPPPKPHAGVHTLHLSSESPNKHGGTQVVPRLIAHLLSFSHVTRVFLEHHIHIPECDTHPEPRQKEFRDIITALGGLQSLEDLAWNVDPNQFYKYRDKENEGFRNLQRMVYGPRKKEVQKILGLPKLEAVYYSFAYGRSSPPPLPFSRKIIHRPSIIPSSLNLRDSPNLAIIHHLPFNVGKTGLGIFDRLDQIDISSANGQVNSYLHNGEVALQTYLLNYDLNGWEHRTDFRGRAVPLWVFEEMRVAEGKSEEEWRGRGVEVGEKAWAILEGWYSEE